MNFFPLAFIVHVLEEELQQALRKLKTGRSGDSKGLVAEMLKNGGKQLAALLLRLFNDIVKPNAETPTIETPMFY